MQAACIRILRRLSPTTCLRTGEDEKTASTRLFLFPFEPKGQRSLWVPWVCNSEEQQKIFSRNWIVTSASNILGSYLSEIKYPDFRRRDFRTSTGTKQNPFWTTRARINPSRIRQSFWRHEFRTRSRTKDVDALRAQICGDVVDNHKTWPKEEKVYICQLCLALWATRLFCYKLLRGVLGSLCLTKIRLTLSTTPVLANDWPFRKYVGFLPS